MKHMNHRIWLRYKDKTYHLKGLCEHLDISYHSVRYTMHQLNELRKDFSTVFSMPPGSVMRVFPDDKEAALLNGQICNPHKKPDPECETPDAVRFFLTRRRPTDHAPQSHCQGTPSP